MSIVGGPRGEFLPVNFGAHTTTTSAEDNTPATLLDAPVDSLNVPKSERPVRTCDKRKYNKSKADISKKNEITQMYFTKMNKTGNKMLKRGRLDEIIKEAKMRNSLTEDIRIDKALIHQRIKQNLFVWNGHCGTSSPLSVVEPSIVNMLIILAQMRESLSPSQRLLLSNNLIRGIDAQKNANFLKMYDLVYKEMEDTGVTVWLDNPEWQDHNRNVCDQKNDAGCRVAHDHTEWEPSDLPVSFRG